MRSSLARHRTTLALLGFSLVACGNKPENIGNAGAPPPAKVEKEQDVNLLTVDHPEQFPLFKATSLFAAPTLSVTGTVNPDINRTVPVISLATGRVVEIRARLGDTVQKGQVLARIDNTKFAADLGEVRAKREAASNSLKLLSRELELTPPAGDWASALRRVNEAQLPSARTCRAARLSRLTKSR